MKQFTNDDQKRYSFLDNDPFPEPAHELSRQRKGSQATVTTITFSESQADLPKTDSHDLNPKFSQATLTELPANKHIGPQLTRTRRVAIMVALSLGCFLSMLDQSILGSALPAITNQFGELSSITWVTAAYMLT
ncbi:hypothetical protein GGH96_005983, partial [Coemansia sp. RSA 1972]